MQKGKKAAFKRLVNHYQQIVYQVCYLITGSEKDAVVLARDSFIYAYEHFDEYDDNQQLSLWLYKIVISLAPKPFLEDKKSICPLVEKVYPLFTSNLSCKERLVLDLKFNNQLSIREIGKVLGLQPSLISTYIITAREKIRESLCDESLQSTLT